MFFYLSKLLNFLFSPYMWTFILLGVSLFITREDRKRRLRIIAIVLLYVTSNSFLVDELYRCWEPVTEDHDLKNKQYTGAIVLGGIGDIDLRLQKINFGYAADRLFQTLAMYHQGKIGKIVFTGGSGSIEFPEKREAVYVRKYLQLIKVPDSSIVIEPKSRNTYENAVFTKRILDSLHIHGNFLLVTSALHMPRSMAVFKKAGYASLTPYVTNRSSGARRFTPDHLFFPNAGAVLKLEFILHEWFGYIIYKLKGYA
jgi:uncharacterized SAM-binding protein YcdF (DUF218 family)